MAWLSPAEAGVLLMLLLALASVMGADSAAKKPEILRRTKRTWILPPAKIKENTDYTNLPFIAKIHSDKDQEAKVAYFLTGEGANKPPYNLFVVDHETGFVRITGIVDRETHPNFRISAVAKYANGSVAEPEIPLVVTILDENDNPPYFEVHSGNITEASKQGTFVMQIEGKDNDQQGTINSQIAYSIVSQEPEGTHMFWINEVTGELYVKEPTLDRETIDFYRLVVKGTDMGGQPGGLTGTGTVEIHVLDINDNIPTLEHSEYTGSVDENIHDVVVMRIKALDKDLEHTDNWLTVFKIAKGNEDNLFSIETDEETNEGVLKLIKSVDFEDIQNLEIGLIIENVAPFVEGSAVEMDVDVQVGEGHRPNTGVGGGAGVSGEVHGSIDAGMEGGLDGGLDVSLEGDLDGGVGGGLSGELEGGLSGELHPEGGRPGGGSAETGVQKSYLIKITVNNVPEGPEFMPETKEVPVSEDPNEQPEDGIIAEFTATDPDTGKPAEDVIYVKSYDPDNWFVIDEETAEIKLNKQPDRESPFLVNGTYFAKILAISKDMPSKTATGTIAIKVTDSNDHCPTLTTTHTSLCSDKKTVYVTAVDEDQTPNAAPFTFTLVPDGTRGSWDIELINETTTALHSSDNLWPGVYELQVKVADAQGHSCPADEVFTVSVCTCVDTDDCSHRATKQTAPSSKLSAAVIGPLLLAMCLLLLIPLVLLFCDCGGADSVFPDHFSELPFDAKEQLISYHTEGRGEDKEVPLHSVPIILENQKKVEMAPAITFNTASKFTETQQSFYNETMQQFQETSETIMEIDNAYGMQRESFKRGNSLNRQTFAVQSSSDIFDEIALSNDFLEDYFTQKAMCAEPGKDVLLDYGFEGQGSPAGSLGCCSLLESENDLQFLNDLGPKFKTLAEICSPPKPTPCASVTHKVASAVSTTQIHSPPPAAPKASLTSKVVGAVSTTVDLVQPVVKPKIEQSVETKHTDIRVETVVSSSNTSQSSVTTAPPTIVLPQSQVTGLGYNSNIVQAATLPRPGQAVVLQQQPVYYTTDAVLQPMQYVVQPQIQNTVLLTNSTHGGKVPGLYVVSGPQNAPSSGLMISTTQGPPSGLVMTQGPPSGLVMTQGPPSGLVIQGTESPESPVSPISPVNPTVLLPVGSVVPQGSVSAEGWKMVGPNPVGNLTLVKNKSSPAGMQLVALGSSQDILPRGAILVKEAAPPQGALSPAAQGSVFGPLPKHTVVKRVGVVAVKEPGWEGQSKREGLETVIIGPPQMGLGMGHTVTLKPEVSQARTWPVVIGQPAVGKVSVNQFQQIPPQEETTDGRGVRKTRKIRSPTKEKDTRVKETITTAKTTKSHQPLKIKTAFQEESHLVYDAHSDKADEKQNVSAFKSEQLRKLNDKEPGDFVKSEFEDKVSIQQYQTEGEEPQEDTVKTLLLNVSETSSEQSVRDELIIISEASSDKFTDEINQEEESSDTEEEVVPPKNKADENMSVDTHMSSTEFIPGPVVSESDNGGKEKECTLMADHIDTVEDQVRNSLEESVGKCEAVPCENEALEQEDESIELTVGESFEDRQINDSQDPYELGKDVSLSEKVVEDFETCGVTVAPEPTEEEVEEPTAVTTDDGVEALDMELSAVGGEGSATLPTKILATTESEGKPSVAQETTPELQTDDSETEEIQECPAETDTAGEEDVSALETNKVIVTSTQVQAEEITEDLSATTDNADEEVEEQPLDSEAAEDVDNQPVTSAESEVEADEVESDAEKDSQQSFISDEDQDEDADRQHKLSRSYETEDGLIPNDNISLEEKSEAATDNMVSPVQQNVVFLDDKDKEHDVEDTSDETLIPNNKEIVEVAALPLQEDVNTAAVQEEGFESEEAKSPSPSVEDQLILEDNTIDGVEEDVEEAVASVQHTACISDEDEATEVNNASHGDPEDNTEDEIRETSLSEEDLATGEENEPHADSHEEGQEEEDQEEEEKDEEQEEEEEEEEEESLLVQQKTPISDEDEASDDHDRPSEGLKEDDQQNSDDDVRDGASEDVEEEVPPIKHSASMLENNEAGVVEDTSYTANRKEQLLASDDNVSIMDHEVPSVQQTVYIPEDQRAVGEEEAAVRTSLQSDDHMNFSDSVHDEDKGGISTSPLQQNFSIPDEEDDELLGTNSREEGVRSCQTLEVGSCTGEVTEDTVGLESMVATGQVFSSRADRGATGSNFVPGQFSDDVTNLPSYQTPDVQSTELKEEEDLALEKAEAEGLFETREGLVNAPAQAAPTCYSGAEVVNEILAPVLETHLGSVEKGGESLISEEAEEAANLVQNESFNVRGETEGTACSTGAESEASCAVQELEASGGQENPERQTLVGQTPRSKSQKSLQRSKSTPGKCKQQ